MHITKMRLFSYGPFEDSGEIELRRGINLLVGQNNSGKSAVLRSLRPDALSWPHRNLSTFREIDLLPSYQELEIDVDGQDIRRAFMEAAQPIWWPVDRDYQTLSPTEFEREYFAPMRRYQLRFQRNQTGALAIPGVRTVGGIENENLHGVQLTVQRPSFSLSGIGAADAGVELPAHLWATRIFRFDAERMNIGRCAQQESDELTPNAANLASVLQRMRGHRPQLFDELVSRVREVLPSIHAITTAPIGGSETEIYVWPTEHQSRREYGFPLADSGTGVSQVLAILTAVMTREPSIIVIDEANSFLHPAAVKALLRILKTEHAAHQYIISTHSAEVISASQPDALCVVKKDGFDSSTRMISAGDVEELRDLGDLLGISIGDIFAADRVLWVEGRTEELCLPLLLERLEIDIPAGLVVSPVVATGDFNSERKNADLIFSVYDRLSRVTLPLVRSVTFTFDRENLSDGDIRDLERRAKARLLLLPRRHIECYVVDAGAITEFIRLRDPEVGDLDTQTTEAVLTKLAGREEYGGSAVWRGDLQDEEWLGLVNAAKLLHDTIGQLTEHRISFRKTTDTYELFELVLRLNPATLASLDGYLRQLMGLVGRDQS